MEAETNWGKIIESGNYLQFGDHPVSVKVRNLSVLLRFINGPLDDGTLNPIWKKQLEAPQNTIIELWNWNSTIMCTMSPIPLGDTITSAISMGVWAHMLSGNQGKARAVLINVYEKLRDPPPPLSIPMPTKLSGLEIPPPPLSIPMPTKPSGLEIPPPAQSG